MSCELWLEATTPRRVGNRLHAGAAGKKKNINICLEGSTFVKPTHYCVTLQAGLKSNICLIKY